MSTENRTLIIRADANTRIGTGHLMRCLALAQAWQDHGGKAVFITACNSPALKQRLWNEGFDVVELQCAHPDPADLKTAMNVLAVHPGAWLVLDGYQFDSTYQRLVKEAGHQLLVIDDMAHLDRYYADIVLNQNIHAHNLHYFCEPYTRLLLGTKYVLLRREFWPWRNYKREVPEVAKKVLVTMGGSDPDNITLKVIQALARIDIPDLEAVVVVGPSNPHRETLRRAVESSPLPISLVENVENMPELMAWADVSISAGGSTCWELLFLGVPSSILILADNQRKIAEHLGAVGVALNLGWYRNLCPIDMASALRPLLVAPDRRVEMIRCGQKMVDSEGTGRVLMRLRGQMLRLRRVCEDDCRLLWEWANEPAVRISAFSSGPIPWEDHVQWFAWKIHDPNCFFFIALDEEDKPVGQVRFDANHNDEAEIDVSIDRSKRGLGYGSLLVSMAVEEIFRVTSLRAVHAFVKPENTASIRVFEKSKFKKVGIETVGGNTAIHYVRLK